MQIGASGVAHIWGVSTAGAAAEGLATGSEGHCLLAARRFSKSICPAQMCTRQLQLQHTERLQLQQLLERT